jgi:hypothetical protein
MLSDLEAAKPVVGYIGFGALDNFVLYLAASSPTWAGQTPMRPGSISSPARP